MKILFAALILTSLAGCTMWSESTFTTYPSQRYQIQYENGCPQGLGPFDYIEGMPSRCTELL